MSQPLKPPTSPGYDPRSFTFGEMWRVRNENVVFPDEKLFSVTPRLFRTVVILQDCPLNTAFTYPLIRIAPITTTVRDQQPWDIELTPTRDGVLNPCYVRLGLKQSILKNDLEKCLGSVSTEVEQEIIATEFWALNIDPGS